MKNADLFKDTFGTYATEIWSMPENDFLKWLNEDAKPKTGHWIDIMVGDMPAQACDRCNTFYPLSYTGGGHRYCPHCGCRMVEPQESEDKK